MVLGVLECPADFLTGFFDRSKKSQIFVKWELNSDRRCQTIERFTHRNDFEFWDSFAQ